MVKAMLALEDGTIFTGTSVGAAGEKIGRVVFHTGVVGYEGILSDPATRGQIVSLSYPLVGNYGINLDDLESGACQAGGLVVKEISRIYSNWRAAGSLENLLRQHGVVALAGVDTRDLVLHLRERGEMRGVISTLDQEADRLVAKARTYQEEDTQQQVEAVACTQMQELYPVGPGQDVHLVVVDLGITRSLLAQLEAIASRLTLVAPGMAATQLRELNPDGVILAGGPGDGSGLPAVVATCQQLLGWMPLLGVGLGCQVLGVALGGQTRALKVGHHGFNQAIRHKATGKVEVSRQHHSYVLEGDRLPGSVAVTWTNLVDGTVEGISSLEYPAVGFQYHPVVPDAGLISPELLGFAALVREFGPVGKERK